MENRILFEKITNVGRNHILEALNKVDFTSTVGNILRAT